MSRFRRIVWSYYRKYGRHDLPWRKTHDAYKILVSEVMLQQTQVERVIPFYKKFSKQFPTAKKLTAAPLSDVLKTWQGLGYNRRAKMLHAAAKELETRKKFSVAELEELPGVGPYTARAVAAFASNQDVIFVETNIRTAVIHHFFQNKKKVADAEIEKIANSCKKSKSLSDKLKCAEMVIHSTLKKIKSDSVCRHYAECISKLFLVMNIKQEFIAKTPPHSPNLYPDPDSHAWNEIEGDSGTYYLDAHNQILFFCPNSK